MPAIFHSPNITGIDPGVANTGRLFMVASPNPSSSFTRIYFGLPRSQQQVRAQIFDAQGRLVSTLANGPMTAGTHTLDWSTRQLPTGQYFFRLTTEGGLTSSGKLVVVR
jgi:flagellar hook assembly protein FlgD